MAEAVANYATTGAPNPAGCAFIAPLGTALPKTATEKLGEAFKSLGLVSSDGLQDTFDISSTDLTEWGGNTVLSISDSYKESAQFTLIEQRESAHKFVFGDDMVTGSDGGAMTIDHSPAGFRTAHVLVFDMFKVDGGAVRWVIPNAKITNLDNIGYVVNDYVAYSVTATLLPGGFNEEGKDEVTSRLLVSAPGAAASIMANPDNRVEIKSEK